MKPILVPTDFSPNADLAMHYAAALAQKAGAPLMLMHSCTLLDERYARHKALIREANEAQVAELNGELRQRQGAVLDRWKIEASVHLFNTENITECMLRVAEEQAALVVMGTHGRTGLRRKLFGSRTAAVINRSHRPVMTVPPDFNGQLPDRMLLAVAGFEDDLEVFEPVFELAQWCGSSVTAAAFTESSAEAHEWVTNAHHLQQTCERLSARYPQVRCAAERLSGENFEESISAFISEKGIGLLAMVTRERGFWERIFDSSLTQEMSYTVQVPLLAVHRR
jgi:nucleotide-binding universal stress UspA family protein